MRQTVLISLAAALIFFTLGYAVGGNLTGQAPGLNQPAGTDTFQAGWEAARRRLSDSGFMPMIGNYEIKNVSGEVKSLSDNDIILKIKPLEPLADPALDERTVEIDGSTKYYLFEQKDRNQYQGEMAEFNNKMGEQTKKSLQSGETPEPIRPPEPFNKKQVSLSDVKIGTILNVTAAEDDIKNSKIFKAEEIIIHLPISDLSRAGQ